MKVADFALLSDENIDPAVVQYLRAQGFDVRDICEEGLQGMADVEIIRRAVRENRIVVTHDSDFGKLAIQAGERIVGILYLRPGHIVSGFTIETIRVVLAQNIDVTPPFLLIARRTGTNVAIRYRPLNP